MVENVLKPMNELIAGTAELAFLGVRRCARENEYGHAAARHIVDRARERLGSALYVDDDRLRPPCELRISLGASQCHHLIRARDYLGSRLALSLGLRQRFK